jgi:toxin ParE1/3/4
LKLALLQRPDAVEDVFRAADFYQGRGGPLLAERFIAELQQAFAFLTEFPHAAAVHDFDLPALAGMRRWRLKRFPFYVFYQVANDSLTIVRVLHTAMDLEKQFRS